MSPSRARFNRARRRRASPGGPGNPGEAAPDASGGAFSGRTIILGVTGSVAAFKAADLAGKLVRGGATVETVLTPAGARFVGPATFRALTGRPVVTDMWEEPRAGRVGHVSLARAADAVLVAPATADIIARFAHGLADDMLTTTVLATTAPVVVAPAMNHAMWANRAVRDNVTALRRRGFVVVEPGTGMLACGESGKGRLADAADILAALRSVMVGDGILAGKRVLVTAGPTREPLDAVRYISNPSSGRMGYEVAGAAQRRGADVTLVSGPSSLEPPRGAKLVRVTTGAEMRREVLKRFPASDVLVATAAVTDYRPRRAAAGKNKARSWRLELEKVGNILEEAARKRKGQVIVGFAAEAGDPVREGRRKLKARRLDLVVANDITVPGSGFASEDDRAVLVFPGGKARRLPRMPKRELAVRIIDEVARIIDLRRGS